MRDLDPNEVKSAAIKALGYWKPGRDPIVRVPIYEKIDLGIGPVPVGPVEMQFIEFEIREMQHGDRCGIGAFMKGLFEPIAHTL